MTDDATHLCGDFQNPRSIYLVYMIQCRVSLELMKTSVRIYCSLIAAMAGLCIGGKAYATVGATTPFTSVEAESGKLGGGAAVVTLTSAPTTQYSSAELEASG